MLCQLSVGLPHIKSHLKVISWLTSAHCIVQRHQYWPFSGDFLLNLHFCSQHLKKTPKVIFMNFKTTLYKKTLWDISNWSEQNCPHCYNWDCHMALLRGNALQIGYAAISCRHMIVANMADQPATLMQSDPGVRETMLWFVDCLLRTPVTVVLFQSLTSLSWIKECHWPCIISDPVLDPVRLKAWLHCVLYVWRLLRLILWLMFTLGHVIYYN